MIELPYTPGADDHTVAKLPVGTHEVRLCGIRMVKKVNKLLVTYENAAGAFDDWLGFVSPAQSGRSYAYVCRLHELCGLPAPKGSFNEAALLSAAANHHTGMRITIMADGDYFKLADFPSAGEPGAIAPSQVQVGAATRDAYDDDIPF